MSTLNNTKAKGKPTFFSTQGNTTTDLILIPAEEDNQWERMQITDLWTPDEPTEPMRHGTILATSNNQIELKEKSIDIAYAINYNKADHRCFNKLWESEGQRTFDTLVTVLQQKVTDPTTTQEQKEELINQGQLLFYGILHTIAIRVYGLRKITTKEINTHQRGEELSELKQRYWDITHNRNQADNLNQLNKEVDSYRKKAKALAWEKKMNKLVDQNITQVFKRYKKEQNRYKIAVEEKLIAPNGKEKYAETAYQEYCEEELFKKPADCTTEKLAESVPHTEAQNREDIDFITTANIIETIRELKPGRSPGLSGIPIAFYKGTQKYLGSPIQTWFELLKQTNIVPLTLKLDIKNPHPKYTQNVDINIKKKTQNQRPITLQNNLYKILDGNIKKTLEELNTKQNIIFPEQGGFKKQEGTIEQVFVLQNIFHSNTQVRAAFLDLRKAYDSVWREALAHKLRHKIGIPENLVSFIEAMYRNTKSIVRVNQRMSICFPTTRGLQQGALSSPILFNLFINDLIQHLKETKVGLSIGEKTINNLLFADDIVLCAKSEKDLQTLLDTCTIWADKWHLEFNPKKSQLISSRRDIEDLQLQGENIKQAPMNTYKYLGFPVSGRGVKVAQYLKIRRQGFFANMKIMKHYSDLNALNARNRAILYKSMIRAHYDYGLSILHINEQELKELERDQEIALRKLLPFPNLTEYKTILFITGIPSMQDRMDTAKSNFCHKLTKKTGTSISKETYQQLKDNSTISARHLDRIQPLATLKKSLNRINFKAIHAQNNNMTPQVLKQLIKTAVHRKAQKDYGTFVPKQLKAKRNKITNGWLQTPLHYKEIPVWIEVLRNQDLFQYSLNTAYIPTKYFDGIDKVNNKLAYCDNNPDWYVKKICEKCGEKGVDFQGLHDIAQCKHLQQHRNRILNSIHTEIDYFKDKYKIEELFTQHLNPENRNVKNWLAKFLLGSYIKPELETYQALEVKKMLHSHLYLLCNMKNIANDLLEEEAYETIHEGNIHLTVNKQDLRKGKIVVRTKTEDQQIHIHNIRKSILNLEVTKLEQYNIGLGAASTRTAQQKIKAQKYADKIIAQLTTTAIMTDGSINQKEKKGGIGLTHFDPTKQQELSSCNYAINTEDAQVAELAGILKATQISKDYKKDVTILCDCKTAINYIKNTFTPPYRYVNLVQKIQENLWELRKVNHQKIELIWIPGHIDNHWNDRADLLAKQSAKHWSQAQFQASPEITIDSDNSLYLYSTTD